MASAGGVGYGYDALGRMVTRTGSAGTTPVSYLGTGTSLASDGTSRYSYDPSGGMTAEGPASGGAGYAVMADQHGDVAAAFAPTSSASTLEGSASYGPYGTVTASGSMPGAGYQGDYTDPVTGLVYMNARWYNPAAGGFVSSDTAGGTPVPSSVDGNPYAYAGGNPLTGTDPTGHCGWCSDLGHALVGFVASPVLAPAELATGVGEFALGVGGIAAAGAAAKAYEYLINQMVSGWNRFADSFGYNPYGYSSSSVSPSGGGSPAPGSYAEFPEPGHGWRPVNSPSGGGGPGSGGGGPGTGGSSWVVPAGTCTIACAPPPPPPPPQDCYAGPNPTCTVAAPPGALLHTPLITHVVSNITSYNQLCSQGDCVTEHDKPLHGTVKGTTPGGGSNVSTASTDDSAQNVRQLLQPVRDQGVEPEPQTSAAGAGSRGGTGGGACTPGNSALPDQPSEEDLMAFAASWVSELPPMTYQTYIKKNPETGQVYAGKTSGRGTPLRNVTQRNYGHAYNKKGFGPAQLDKSSTNEDAIKGREQMLIDYYISLGISGNSDRNPLVTNRESCIQQAINEFGPLP
jgi:RHS repeat-associated protein